MSCGEINETLIQLVAIEDTLVSINVIRLLFQLNSDKKFVHLILTDLLDSHLIDLPD